MSEFRLEPHAGDAAAVRRLVASTRVFSPEEEALAESLVSEELASGGRSGYRFVFAERAGELEGYTCFGAIPATLGSFDLYWIAVAPGARGRGLGRRLMAASEALIAEAGGTRIYIDTSSRKDYAPAHALYRGSGYSLEATLEDFYAPGDAKWIFAKRLGAAAPRHASR